MAKAQPTSDVLATICEGGASACLIVCADFTRRERAIARVRETRLAKRATTALLGSELDARRCRDVVDQARNLSLFEPCRGFIVRDYEGIPPESLKKIAPLVDDKGQTAFFIFSGTEARASHPLVKALRAQQLCLELPALEGVEIRRWMEREAKRLQISIEGTAGEQLLTLADGSLDALATALLQLSLYVNNPKVSSQDVTDLFAVPSQTREYELLDSAMRGNSGKLLALCEQLIREGKNAFLLLNLLHRSVLQYLTIQSLRTEGMNDDAIRAKLGLPPWLYQRVSTQARKCSLPQLKTCVDLLVRADSKLKGRSLGEPLLVAEAAQALHN